MINDAIKFHHIITFQSKKQNSLTNCGNLFQRRFGIYNCLRYFSNRYVIVLILYEGHVPSIAILGMKTKVILVSTCLSTRSILKVLDISLFQISGYFTEHLTVSKMACSNPVISHMLPFPEDQMEYFIFSAFQFVFGRIQNIRKICGRFEKKHHSSLLNIKLQLHLLRE